MTYNVPYPLSKKLLYVQYVSCIFYKQYHLIEDLKLNLVPDIGVISFNCVLVWQGTRLLEW